MKTKYINYINDNLPRLDGKTVVITGGTGGIGYHITKYLVHLGANVVLAARNETKAIKVINNIINEVNNAKIIFKYLDLTNMNSVNCFIYNIINNFNSFCFISGS